MFQIKAFDLEQSLQEVTERYEKEKQKRRALHNSLVVSIFNDRAFSYLVVIMPMISSPIKLLKLMNIIFLDVSPPPAVYVRCIPLLRHICLATNPTPFFFAHTSSKGTPATCCPKEYQHSEQRTKLEFLHPLL